MTSIPRSFSHRAVRVTQSPASLLRHPTAYQGRSKTSPVASRFCERWGFLHRLPLCPSARTWCPNTRQFSTSRRTPHGHLEPPEPGKERKITIVDQSAVPHTFEVSDGSNILDIAQANELDMEGACGGSCACSTCHVIVQDQDMYDKIAEPTDDENDMLDLAFGLTETSRLGCQVEMSKELDGLVVKLPSATRNLQKKDFESR